jgi:ABC-type glycerol-3-phosphate transport system permease component
MMDRIPGEGFRPVHRFLFWAGVVATVVIVGFPLYWMVISSITPYQMLFSRTLHLFPFNPTLEHYRDLLLRTRFPTYFLNSTIVAVITTGGAVVAATLAGYGLTRFNIRGRSLISSSILYVYMFPTIMLTIPLFVVLKQAGLVNSYIGLALAQISFALPFAMWLSAIFIEAVPVELDEAAMIDGASRLRTLWSVVLPVALPGLVATTVFVAVLSWNDYLMSLVLMVSENRKTLPVGVASFADATSVEWGLVMAGGVLVTLPMLIGFTFVQRHLVQGLGAGAVKG